MMQVDSDDNTTTSLSSTVNINDNSEKIIMTNNNNNNNNNTINNENKKIKNEDEVELSFASFYYSLKVSKGKDEREDVQKKTFAKWINAQLTKINAPPIKDLFIDLRDGTVLLKLLELLTGKELKKEIGRMKVHHLGNLNTVISTLKDAGIRLINISAIDIYEGNPKLTLGLVWYIIQHWQVRDVLKSVVTDIHTTNLEKTLLQWCQNATKGYKGVDIKDFTKSWRDGLAFNAIIHKYKPHLFDYNILVSSGNSSEKNLEHAFELAHAELNIERLLDIEDVIAEFPDKKSIMMYVMCYFQVLSQPKYIIEDSIVTKKVDTSTNTSMINIANAVEAPLESSKLISSDLNNKLDKVDSIIIPNLNNDKNNDYENNDVNKKSNRKITISGIEDIDNNIIDNKGENNSKMNNLESYLQDLSKVIEWLIESDNILTKHGSIGNDVNTVKQQFQVHEDFMLDLTQHQNNVGQVLQDGSKLINSSLLNQNEDNEVRQQMKLLNDMWENLRIKAVDKQSKLHETLMKLQTEQLNQMDLWLLETEKRIDLLSQLADSLDGLKEQKQELANLQDDLIKEQEAVDCLKQIIVVVDDTTEDQAFNDLETRLTNLSDRWSNVCKFVSARWHIIQDLINKLENIDNDYNDITIWTNNKSIQLKELINKIDNISSNINSNSDDSNSNKNLDLVTTSSLIINLIKTLKDIEIDMQKMHTKLNEMNEIGEQISLQLNNSPQLTQSLNNKMDMLENKWNDLLYDMEYLSKKCNEQHVLLQEIELQQQEQQKLEIEEAEKAEKARYQQFNVYISQLYKVFNKIAELINSNITNTDESMVNFDEQHEAIKQAITELRYNEKLFDNVRISAENLIEEMKKSGQDSSEIEESLNLINNKWFETKQKVDDLAQNLDKNLLKNKIYEELATLNDVHEGYQQYINSVEPVANDISKINIQIENNKVKLKGMNSYETRLNDLKQLAIQLDNNEVNSDIDSFIVKWTETYKKINNRNDDIDKIADIEKDKEKQRFNSSNSLNTYNISSSIDNSNSSHNTTPSSINFQQELIINEPKPVNIKKTLEYSNMATTSTSVGTQYSNMNINNPNISSRKSSSSDEDIVHVVTNVYQIPVIQQQQSQISNLNDSTTKATDLSVLSQLTHQIGGLNSNRSEQKLFNGEPRLEFQTKTSSSTVTSSKVIHKVIDASDINIQQKSTTRSNIGGGIPVKEKYQIRSIVEIYENPLQDNNTIDIGKIKTNKIIEETKKYETNIIKFDDDSVFQSKDDRQNVLKVNSEQQQQLPSEAYLVAKQTLIEWLINVERTLKADEFQITFLPILEEKFKTFKELQKDVNDQKGNHEYIQRVGEEIINNRSKNENLRIDLNSLKLRYNSVQELVYNRILKLEKAVIETKEFQEEYKKAYSSLQRIETYLKSELLTTDTKLLYQHVEKCRNNAKDLESINLIANKLNDYVKNLYVTTQPSSDPKYLTKIKSDMHELNEKLMSLGHLNAQLERNLQDALKMTVKIDDEIEIIEIWINEKEREIDSDEISVILSEEQIYGKYKKFTDIKNEIDFKEPQVKNIFNTGNNLLKNSNTAGTVADLAQNMMNLNTKWTNFYKKADSKYKYYHEINQLIVELKQLLEEEKLWLDKIETKVSQSRIGADAEELSEELDILENLLKSHSSQYKDKIVEISNKLTEKRILIPLVSQHSRDYQIRLQRLIHEATTKIQNLDNAINDVQNWERKLYELKDWIIYMDKYLTTRIEQDIYADDVPDDTSRIQDEFNKNEIIIKELDDVIHRYKQQDKSNAAYRLEQQLDLLKKTWNELSSKFKKFQKPSDFDVKLQKMRKSIDEIHSSLHKIDIYNEDSDVIHLQLEQCMKFYKTLSEIKSDIENLLKQGRLIVDRRQVDNTEELTIILDNLKQNYNELGSRVTHGKNDLEKAFKLAKKFRKEYNLINEFLNKIDGELKKIEQKPLSKNFFDELEWIKNTRVEISKVKNIVDTLKNLHQSLQEYIKNKTQNQNDSANKIRETEEKLIGILTRLDNRANFIQDESQVLEENYKSFISRLYELNNRIEIIQQNLINIERTNDKDRFNDVDRELSQLLSDIEVLRSYGSELSSKSDKHSKSIENELRTLLRNFDDLNRRNTFIQNRVIQENITTTVTTSRQSKFAEQSKYLSNRRRDRSPSESSVDSTVDVFDPELRQKYMRAVAYLRILDEAPIQEENESRTFHFNRSNESVDIDYVIQQAKQVAKLNEHINPERARRILEKAHKLEQRWSVTKIKRDSLRSSSKIYNKYKEREGNLNEQITYLEQQLSEYKSNRQDEYNSEPFGRLFYGPSDFIYDSDFVLGQFPYQQQQQQQQHCCHHQHQRQQRIIRDNFDTRSVISEPPISRSVVCIDHYEKPATVIRKYKTTKTTTTTHHAPNGMVYTTQQHEVNGVPVFRPINIQKQQEQQAKTRNVRSSSIPASTQRNFMNASQQNINSTGANTSRYYSSRNTATTNRTQYGNNSLQKQQQQFITPPSPSVSVRAASTPRQINGNEEIYHKTYNTHQYNTSYRENINNSFQQQQQKLCNNNSTRTLPVNYKQTNYDSFNNTLNTNNNTIAYSPSSSCIDYSNTHYNSDWTMRHPHIEPINP